MTDASTRSQPPDEGEEPDHMRGEVQASVRYSNHDLREMFSRDNAERRRSAGKMLRAKLTPGQDKQVMNKMVKIREAYTVTNSDEVVLKWVQLQVAEGQAEGIDKDLLALAKKAVIPERVVAWDDAVGR